jgi:SAM-dependent methyltransferase
MRMKKMVFDQVRWWLMPGFDLFTRRRVRLCRHWKTGPRRVLDAGSGNGWFSYLAYRSGATVQAVNIVEDQVEKATRFYNGWRGIPTDRLSFRMLNLYEIDCFEAESFDEIICYETLEHIKNDGKVCTSFHRLLKPGGVLHLCCPYAEHPRWKNEPLDLEEKGYHTRAGYTLESYRALLEPIGFRIEDSEGMGSPLVAQTAMFLMKFRTRFGDLASLPLSILAMPLIGLDGIQMECPYSLYVRAMKPAVSA